MSYPVVDGTGAVSSKIVLIVDDDAGMTSMLSTFLFQLGYSPRYLNDSNTVLPWLESHVSDGVIVDLRMPGLDGILLIRAIRKRHRLLPIVIYTGFGYEEGKMKEALDAGMWAWKKIQVALKRALASSSALITSSNLAFCDLAFGYSER